MPIYVVSASPGPAIVRAGANDIRIVGAQIDNSGAPILQNYFYLSWGTTGLTGGTALTPVPLRPNAPASTATGRVGSGAAVSGGSSDFIGPYAILCPAGGGSFPSGTYFAQSTTWQPMGDLILPPGSAFRIDGDPEQCVIWYEEFLVDWR